MTHAFNVKQHIPGPTHRDGHTLDLIIARQSDIFIFEIYLSNYLASDHSAILCPLHIGHPPPQRIEIQTRKLNQFNIAAFQDAILSSPLYT
ncbi:hypothetical protein HOLleu_30432 [Holothuria leucospilota]|uniref:Uncharacterized protein n=1 Tax=Holothuria leucospilota TaxID=206669 RepID=A0A9Q1H147_HOLLE|nr:hypothetical protein HOLleu_30432 [Holothuria leucospilota]